MAATGRSLADLASVMTKLPQVLVNVSVGDKAAACEAASVVAAVAEAEAALAGNGGCCCGHPAPSRWSG